MKESYYFSHDNNARSDLKLLRLRQEWGYEGYGIFWGIIECLAEQSEFSFPSERIQDLALALNLDEKTTKHFIDFCLKIELLRVDSKGSLYNKSLLERMRIKKQRLISSKIGGLKSQQIAKSKKVL